MRSATFAALLAIELAAPARLAASPTLPPLEYQRLAREILRELIEIDTTHAHGATRAAEVIAARLQAAGFSSADMQIIGPRPEKGNLIVRYRAAAADPAPRVKPILFLSHLDVVEARPEDWSVDPFKLTEQDGYFYGRGTLDIKDEVANLVTNLIRLKAEGFVPTRDIVVALTDDEEGGDANGVAWLLEHHRDLIDSEYVINTDAGGGQIVAGKRLRNPVQTSEKIFATYRLEVTHPGGHSSMPTRDNAIYRLADGLHKLARFDFPVELNETTRGFFTRLAEQESGQMQADMLAVTRTPADLEAAARLSESPLYNATLRTTCVATMLEAGHAVNALPQRALATVQCRLLPDSDPEEVRRRLIQVLGDPEIVVTLINEPLLSPASPVRPDVMEAVEQITSAMWPGVIVLPVMDVWSTDGAQLRRAGFPVYGVSGVFFDIDDVRAHGRDERIAVQAFYEGVEFMYRLIQSVIRGQVI